MKFYLKRFASLVLVFNIINEVYSWDRARNATLGQFPHLISLEWHNLPISPPRNICGGTIISKYWVLSSGYCIVQAQVGVIIVKAGRHDTTADDEHVQSVQIEKNIIHPKYTGREHLMNLGIYDLSLLKVTPGFVFSDRIQPARLPKRDSFLSGQRLEYNLISSGWGSPAYLIFVNYPTILRTVQLPVISNRVCEIALRNVFHNFVLHNTQMCTRPLDGNIAACTGDFGGPLIQYNSERKPVVIAVRAFSTMNCNTNNLPPVYTSVSNCVKWIKREMKKT